MEKFEEYKYHCAMSTRYGDIIKDLHFIVPLNLIVTILGFVFNWKLGLCACCLDILMIATYIKVIINWGRHRYKELKYEVDELNIEGKREELEDIQKCLI